MNQSLIQILVLAGIAIFLIIKLRSVLGTREGYEAPPQPIEERAPRPKLEVIEGGPDRDIADNTQDAASAAALAAMKRAEPSFNVTEFLKGARAAYEMILMAFDKGEIERIRPFLGDDVAMSFGEAIALRQERGLTIESVFAGVRDMSLAEATFDPASGVAEVTVRFTGELSRAVRDKAGVVVEGSPTTIIKQRDSWTFARRMGTGDPNWQLTATGD